MPSHSTTGTPARNRLEKLPVLVLPDGRGIDESRYILERLEAKHPAPPRLPPDTDGICGAAMLLFRERHREAAAQSAPWMPCQQRKIDGRLRAPAAQAEAREAPASGPTSRQGRCSAPSWCPTRISTEGAVTKRSVGRATGWRSAPPSRPRSRCRRASGTAWSAPRPAPQRRVAGALAGVTAGVAAAVAAAGPGCTVAATRSAAFPGSTRTVKLSLPLKPASGM